MSKYTDSVNVTVTGNDYTIQCPGTIDLRNDAGSVTIQFNLTGKPNCSFPTTSPFGVAITAPAGSNGPSVTSEFSNYTRVSDSLVTVDDANTGGVDYNYAVTVATPAGNKTGDPIIRNRN